MKPDEFEEFKMDPMLKKLYATSDAMVWAEEFCRTLAEHPDITIDEGFMVGWFANAMCTAESLQLVGLQLAQP